MRHCFCSVCNRLTEHEVLGGWDWGGYAIGEGDDWECVEHWDQETLRIRLKRDYPFAHIRRTWPPFSLADMLPKIAIPRGEIVYEHQ